MGKMATKKLKTAGMVVDVKPKIDPFFKRPGSIEDLCGYVAQGGHLAGFCRERGLLYTSVSDWIYGNPDRSVMYARAREERAEVLADEIVSISDEATVETTYEGEEVRLVLDATAVARNRLRVDARKWAASKLKPRKYGDKVTQEITGANGGAVQIAAVNLRGLNDAELEQMELLLKKAGGDSA
jgi:hypothetical protein